ncbi:hypothetical protein WUBG_14952, partial [Wuchereria bancrofti]
KEDAMKVSDIPATIVQYTKQVACLTGTHQANWPYKAIAVTTDHVGEEAVKGYRHATTPSAVESSLYELVKSAAATTTIAAAVFIAATTTDRVVSSEINS